MIGDDIFIFTKLFLIRDRLKYDHLFVSNKLTKYKWLKWILVRIIICFFFTYLHYIFPIQGCCLGNGAKRFRRAARGAGHLRGNRLRVSPRPWLWKHAIHADSVRHVRIALCPQQMSSNEGTVYMWRLCVACFWNVKPRSTLSRSTYPRRP